MSKISIIIPVYYNEDTLMALYDDLKQKILDSIGEYEIVIVNDGSKDNSYEVMKKIRLMDDNVKLVNLSRNFGEHAAILAGLSECTRDCAVTKQADLAEDSNLIPEMYEKWKEGNKVVIATREKRDDSFWKKTFANLYYKIVKRIVNENMPQGGFDCFLIDRKVIDILALLEEKNSSLQLQILWSGFKTAEVPYHRMDREDGGGMWTIGKRVKLAMDSMLGFSYYPIRFMTGVGIVSATCSFLAIINIFVDYFVSGREVEGWYTIMTAIFLSTGLILIMLGLIGEYLWRTLDASRNRPVYIKEEIMACRSDESST